MKSVWRKWFHIPTEGVISDRLLIARLTFDICVILLYLVCMVYAAYALFTSETVLVPMIMEQAGKVCIS